MYRAGLRCEEALALRPRDVHAGRGEIRVNQGKGAKDRVVPTDQATLEIIDRWRAVRPKSEWLFCTLTGDRLDTGYVRKMVARYGAKADIEIRCHPHLLRHTCASELLEDGLTLPEVQQVLGHERLETTAIYQHVANARLRQLLLDRPG
jgi:integrase/recombinase XerC